MSTAELIVDRARELIIDCDAAPFIPKGWRVKEHQKGGRFKWDASSIILRLSDRQMKDPSIEGNVFRAAFETKLMLNANALDYLLDHPDLIPEDWKGKRVLFLGTVYGGTCGDPNVRHLCWDGRKWCWRGTCLDLDLDSKDYAALRAS